jgi:hypothetical protein
MRFALLCYAPESAHWRKEDDDAVMVQHDATGARLVAEGKLGPNLRLMPSTTAMSIRSGPEPLVTDGPFAETKEQLLGLWLLECASLEEALGIAREYAGHAPPGAGLELRPIMQYDHGGFAR